MSGLLRPISQAFGAGDLKSWHLPGRFFRLMAGTAVDVYFLRGGAIIGQADQVDAGFFLKADVPFDEVRLTSAAAQTIDFLVGSGEAGAASAVSVSGSVPVSNFPANQGAYTNSRATVLASGVSTLLAANAARRIAQVQNNSAADYVRLTFDGVDPTAAQGVRIAPGGSWENPAGYAPTGAIKAIAESGAGCAVEVVEG